MFLLLVMASFLPPEYMSDIGVQAELFNTLSKLLVRDEFCQEVRDLGGLDLILKSFQANITHKVNIH